MPDSRGSGPLLISVSRLRKRVPWLARSVRPIAVKEGGYCNFNSDDEVVVVFRGRVSRYQSGDRSARAEVEQYARSMGVPEPQLDWADPPWRSNRPRLSWRRRAKEHQGPTGTGRDVTIRRELGLMSRATGWTALAPIGGLRQGDAPVG